MFNKKLKKRIESLEENRENRIKTTERILKVFGVSLNEEEHTCTTDELLALENTLPTLQKQMEALMDYLKLEFKEEDIIASEYIPGIWGSWGSSKKIIKTIIKVVPKNNLKFTPVKGTKLAKKTK